MRKKKELWRPAPLWKRFLALTIDLLVLEFFVFSHFEHVIRTMLPGRTLSAAALAQLSFVGGALGILVFIYVTVLEYSFGQTLGYMAANIVIVAPDSSLWRIALSNVTFLPFFPFIMLWIIDPLTLLISNNHQRFMHTILGINVVELYALDEVTTQWKV